MRDNQKAQGRGTVANAERTPVIGLAGKRKWGYNVSEVDDFLVRAHDLYERRGPNLTQDEVQRASFDMQRNGYVIGQVDAALIRLERAIVDKETQWDIARLGRFAWDQETRDLAETLRLRAELEPKTRFRLGEKSEIVYDTKQVDTLVEKAWAHITEALRLPRRAREEVKGSNEIGAAQVSNIIFTQKRGKHGYVENSVDAYFNRVIQVLTRLESIARIATAGENNLDDGLADFVPSTDASELPEGYVSPLPSFPPESPVKRTTNAMQGNGLADSDDNFAGMPVQASVPPPMTPETSFNSEQATVPGTFGADMPTDNPLQPHDSTVVGSSSLASLVDHSRENIPTAQPQEPAAVEEVTTGYTPVNNIEEVNEPAAPPSFAPRRSLVVDSDGVPLSPDIPVHSIIPPSDHAFLSDDNNTVAFEAKNAVPSEDENPVNNSTEFMNDSATPLGHSNSSYGTGTPSVTSASLSQDAETVANLPTTPTVSVTPITPVAPVTPATPVNPVTPANPVTPVTEGATQFSYTPVSPVAPSYQDLPAPTPAPAPIPSYDSMAAAAETPSESSSDVERHISDLLNTPSTNQTGSFEIPNLTFPAEKNDESQDTDFKGV